MCDALVTRRRWTRGDRPASSCAACGALVVEGDALRGDIGLEPCDRVDAIAAVEMTLNAGWSRARVLAGKRAAAARYARERRAAGMERGGRVDGVLAPARGSVIRRRSTSTPTEEDRGTPTECEERRLTSSSVQCGQRFVVPDSMFKTPAPSGFGALTAAQTQSPPTREEVKARERSLDAALVRLRSQILFCEEASGRGRRTLEAYGWTEHDVLCAAFRRARYDGDGLIEASRAFLDEQSDLRARADHANALEEALSRVERDVELLSTRDGERRGDDPLDRLWPGESLDNVDDGVRLLSNALKMRSEWARKKAKQSIEAHSKHLRDITRAQNDLFATVMDEGAQTAEKTAAKKAIKTLIMFYKAIYTLTRAHAR